MRSSHPKASTLALATTLFVASTMIAHAQSAAETPSASDKIDTLSTLKVKGKAQGDSKVSAGALGSLSELDTPFSVKSVSSEQIEKQQAYSLSQVFSTDSAVSRSGSDYNGWSSRLIVRGLPLSFTDSTKIDGVPFALFGVNLPLDAMESVQLLKGSAAFMYGFGSPGGIVNYQLKKAPQTGTIASFDAGYRSNNIFSEHFDYGTRFGDNARYGLRVNLTHRGGDTYSDTTINQNSLALSFDARLTDDLTWTVDALYDRNRLTGQQPFLYLDSGYDWQWLPAAISGYTKAGSRDSFNRNRFIYLSSSLKWGFADGWDATLTASHSSNLFQLGQEYFYVYNPAGDYDDTTFDGVDLWSFKFVQAMVEGKFETGPISHDVVAGLSYEDNYEKLGARNFSDQYGTIVSSNLFNIVRGSWRPRSGASDLVPYSDTVQRAAFLSDTVSWGDHWKAILGLRYTEFDERTWDTTDHATTSDYRRYPLTPTVALMYKPTDAQTLYASYVEALEAGSTVGSQYANYGETLDPVESKQYEIGYKWNGRVIDTSIAAFRIDRGAEYADESTNTYVSDGENRYQGLDASIDWHAAQGLTVGASAVYLDATAEKASIAWLVGQRVGTTARFSGNLHADYDFATVPGLSISGAARYTGKTRVDNFTDSERSIDAKPYTLFDTSLSYSTLWSGKNVTFRAGINNVFNRAYWVGGDDSFWMGAPREYMLNVKVDLL